MVLSLNYLLYFFTGDFEMCKENNLAFGVVFKSASSGLWYQNREAAGDIDAVRVDGVTFEKINTGKKGASYSDKHGGFGFMSDCKECNK